MTTKKPQHHKQCGWPYYAIQQASTTNQPALTNDLVIIADCVANAYEKLNDDFLKEKNIDLLCPKIDNNNHCIQKLSNLIKQYNITKIITVEMELKCCGILTKLVKQAVENTNRNIIIKEKIVTKNGQLKEKGTK
ncbi:MAG: hypothetical protein ACOWWO_13550 [Peptococcaceae bacterium]